MVDLRKIPLGTLRSFEAVARLQSVSKAAAELNLTDSAVSHQLRRLEDALGFELFSRLGRGVVLTDPGRVFAKTVSDALQAIAATAVRLSEGEQVGGRIEIACPPMFATGWLAKHLHEFCEDYQMVDCHIRLMENWRVADLGDADIGIVFGVGGWPDRWSSLLSNAPISPVCSPILYQRIGKVLGKPADLSECILIHWDDGAEWRRWLSEAGTPDVAQSARHLHCNDLGIAIDLATNGTGVALVSETLAAAHLRKGILLNPFDHAVEVFGGWYVICNPTTLRRASARLFLFWLLSKFGKEFSVNTLEVDGTGAARPFRGRASRRQLNPRQLSRD